MSFQAYLDDIEIRTGHTPREFIEMARDRGYDSPSTRAGTIVDWLKQDFDIGRGHAMALVHVTSTWAPMASTATSRRSCIWTASLPGPLRLGQRESRINSFRAR